MGDYWFAAGLLLAVFGPVLLLLPVAVFYWLFRRFALAQRLGVTQRGSIQAAHVLLSLLTVALVVTATWVPGRLEFSRLCDELAEPRIHARVKVDGFYLDDSTANSFGQRYLTEEGFAWMEAKDIYRRSAYVRYRREGGKVVSDSLPELTASHAVRSVLEVRSSSIHVARTEITERVTGKLLAEAHSVTYHGGLLGFILGIYGSGNCPNPASAQGSRQFRAYYHLAREVLGGGMPPR